MGKNARRLVLDLEDDEVRELLIAAIEEISSLTEDDHEQVVLDLWREPCGS